MSQVADWTLLTHLIFVLIAFVLHWDLGLLQINSKICKIWLYSKTIDILRVLAFLNSTYWALMHLLAIHLACHNYWLWETGRLELVALILIKLIDVWEIILLKIYVILMHCTLLSNLLPWVSVIAIRDWSLWTSRVFPDTPHLLPLMP